MKTTKTCAAAHLVSGSSNGFREGEEREGQVHETILVRLQLLVTLDNFKELQAHEAHHCGCCSGDGRNDLASYQFALIGRDECQQNGENKESISKKQQHSKLQVNNT